MIQNRPARQAVAGLLALAVHVLFGLALVVGVSWTSLPPVPVNVDLWSALPEPPQPQQGEPSVGLGPGDLPMPPPPAPTEAPPPPPPDIALRAKQEAERQARKQQIEEEIRQREERQRQEVQRRQEEEALRREEQRREAEARRLEEERRAAELRRQAREQLERLERERLAAEMATEQRTIDEERTRNAEHAAQAVAQAARQRMVEDYRGRIRAKIQGYVRLPPTLQGSPEPVYRVRVLPNGEVVQVTLLRSGGQPAYDQEVERAILKASPLPMPPDREVAQEFREIEMRFRPR